MNLNPDNTKLLQLIEDYIEKGNNENYKRIVHELEHGNAFLVVPTDPSEPQPSFPTAEDFEMNIGLHFVNDLKILAVFTSHEALSEWAKGPIYGISLESKTVLKMCENNGIDCIVIDCDLRTSITLHRSKSKLFKNVYPQTGLS